MSKWPAYNTRTLLYVCVVRETQTHKGHGYCPLLRTFTVAFAIRLGLMSGAL